MRLIYFTILAFAAGMAHAPAMARGANGPVFASIGQCNSYLNRYRIASIRGELWDEVVRFENAYCVETDAGVVAVFPF